MQQRGQQRRHVGKAPGRVDVQAAAEHVTQPARQRAELVQRAQAGGAQQIGARRGLGEPELVRGPIRARLQHLFKILVEAGNRAHFLLVAAELFDDPELTRATEEVDARVAPLLDEAIREGVIRSDVPGEFLGDVLEAMVYGAWTSVARQRITAADAQTWLLETFLHGFGSKGRTEAPRPAARARKAAARGPERGAGPRDRTRRSRLRPGASRGALSRGTSSWRGGAAGHTTATGGCGRPWCPCGKTDALDVPGGAIRRGWACPKSGRSSAPMRSRSGGSPW
ncbi:hypothetical protein SAMN02745121_06127 [Nannocystis exedens]|uniref:Uncharacterized protein n=1 Tax=Nannocystis exedens TaxID=54 RepID=A0A1I2EMR3_9BACT|nr:TetR/AcrR family transcriptional regulator C-terminal ligand-binding domain-containing protein [Nannocystis exedens]PCC73953.1 hypothetical protein NAEX_07042 [Nannocystis exedens]SFE93738.1 hypothetical protein SAMN02745121_06127 [Nannocystis exedens]